MLLQFLLFLLPLCVWFSLLFFSYLSLSHSWWTNVHFIYAHNYFPWNHIRLELIQMDFYRSMFGGNNHWNALFFSLHLRNVLGIYTINIFWMFVFFVGFSLKLASIKKKERERLCPKTNVQCISFCDYFVLFLPLQFKILTKNQIFFFVFTNCKAFLKSWHYMVEWTDKATLNKYNKHIRVY